MPTKLICQQKNMPRKICQEKYAKKNVYAKKNANKAYIKLPKERSEHLKNKVQSKK